MGHLFYVALGNIAGGPLTNTGPFLDLKSRTYYSATEEVPGSDFWGGVYVFEFDKGRQRITGDKSLMAQGIAVHSGTSAVHLTSCRYPLRPRFLRENGPTQIIVAKLPL
jgi:hypothetical protein